MEGNSLGLKISMSLSLCSCRGTSPEAPAHYGWPCLCTSSGVHSHFLSTPHTEKKIFPADAQKAVITSVLQLCYCCPPLPLKPIWPWSRPVVKDPAATKYILRLPNFLLRKDRSGTIHLIRHLRGLAHQGVHRAQDHFCSQSTIENLS